METDIRYSESSSRASEHATATSTDEWSNWTTNQICSAIEDERERTLELLTELLVRIQKDVIPEVVATLPGLRGPAGPVGPPGKLPIAKPWKQGSVSYEADVVVYDGACWQALRDTAQTPGELDRICLAAMGASARSPEVHGTFDPEITYLALDIVALNGGSFIAKQNNPGPCPGDGWQLIARQGQRGIAGEKGERGPKGDPGPAGAPAPRIKAWKIDREHFSAVPIMSDGSFGPALELRPLFQQFLDEVGGA
jgi:hypothetical protein